MAPGGLLAQVWQDPSREVAPPLVPSTWEAEAGRARFQARGDESGGHGLGPRYLRTPPLQPPSPAPPVFPTEQPTEKQGLSGCGQAKAPTLALSVPSLTRTNTSLRGETPQQALGGCSRWGGDFPAY